VSASHPPVIDYEGSDYQDRFWTAGGREYEDRVEAVALQRLLPESGKLLLELGAGAGRNTPRYKGFERVVLLDYSRTQLCQAQERLGTVERYIFVAADVYHLPFIPGLFDTATMIRTLHHLVEPRTALRQVRQVLQPGGVFILEFANKRNFKAVFRYLAGKQSWNPFTLEPVEFVSLNFDFHPKAVRSWLEQCGFSICRQLTVSHFRLGILKRALPVGLMVWLDGLAQWTGDLWQFTPSVFIKSEALGNEPAMSQPGSSPVALFRCPECGQHPLEDHSDRLACPACGRLWAIQDGIYDFRQPMD
jgi:ubiquinone/menaquinone biosynthesis C-methylase UbiE